jgi:dipeptidyl aminopeptidase/acylaminoacyl peptidase
MRAHPHSASALRTLVALALAAALAGCGAAPAPARCPAPVASPPAAPPSASAPDAGAPAAGAPAPTAEATLVTEGIPEASAAFRADLAPWLDSRNAFVESITEDGSAMLVSTRFANTYQLHVVRRPGGARTQVTFLPEPVEGGTFVPGAPGTIVYATDVGGSEDTQLYRLELATGTTTRLTDGTSRHLGFVFSEAGDQLAFAGNARNGRDMDVYVGDGRTQASAQLVVEGTGQWTPEAFSPDGKKLLVAEYVSINDSRFHVVDLATRQVTRVTPPEPVAAYRAAVFSRDGGTLYVTSDREGDFVELYELTLATGAFRPLTRDLRWNVEEISLSPDGRTLMFTINEDGYGSLHAMDTRTRRHAPVALPGAPRGVISGLHHAARTDRLAFTLNAPTAPGDAYTRDGRTGRVERWTETEVGGLDRTRFVAPEPVRFRSFDGREIPCAYYRPAGPGPFPVVLDVHGGPEAQARPLFNPVRQYLVARAGVAVLVPNVRGSDGYGKSYLLLDNGERREDSVRDLGALLDWVGTRPELDAARVGIYGGSYGGYMVLAALATYPERLRAGVDMVGIANFVTFLENTAPYRRDLRRAEYGDERDPAMRALLTRISPVTNAARIRSALFVAHGANDPRVPVGEAEQIVRAVRSNGLDAWYMLARNEGHGYDKKENRDAFASAWVRFFLDKLGVPPRG